MSTPSPTQTALAPCEHKYPLTRLQTHPAPLLAPVRLGPHSGGAQHSLAEEGAILQRLPEVGGVAGRVDALAGDLGDPLERLRRQLRAVLAQDLPEKRAARQYSHTLLTSHSQVTMYVMSRHGKGVTEASYPVMARRLTKRRNTSRHVMSTHATSGHIAYITRHYSTLHLVKQPRHVSDRPVYCACCLRVFTPPGSFHWHAARPPGV